MGFITILNSRLTTMWNVDEQILINLKLIIIDSLPVSFYYNVAEPEQGRLSILLLVIVK